MAEPPHIHQQKQPQFISLNDLAGEKVGGKILFSTDDCFGVAENVLKAEAPMWKEGVFTEYGKWMDGWSTRRKKTEGYDWCIIQLGVPGIVHGIDVDTSYFTGNHAPRCSIQAVCLETKYPGRKNASIGTAATEAQVHDVDRKFNCEKWEYIVPVSQLQPGYKTTCHNYFAVKSRKRFTHLRLNIHPDGGIARLRVYGTGVPNWSLVPDHQLIDLVAMGTGGLCLGYSDAHYGHPSNLIQPGRAETVADGWETARKDTRPAIIQVNRQGLLHLPGTDWCVFRLGHPGVIRKYLNNKIVEPLYDSQQPEQLNRCIEIEIDTTHFKGNYPDSCRIEGCLIPEDQETRVIKTLTGEPWRTLLPATKLTAHKRLVLEGSAVKNCGVISHVRLTIAPDGGISRFRLWGYRQTTPGAKL